jgi:hypothetical protein
MRIILRSPALIHFLIIAIPAIAIAYGIVVGPESSAATFFQIASDWFFAIGLGIAVIAVGVGWTLRRRPYAERAVLWQVTTFLVGAELIIESFSFQLAVALPAAGLTFIALPAAWLTVWSIPRLRRTRSISSFVV